jgi:hypothetical protein
METESAVANRVDAAMDAMQLPSLHPLGDAVLPYTRPTQLRVGDDTMLPRREPSNFTIRRWRVAFFPHGGE